MVTSRSVMHDMCCMEEGGVIELMIGYYSEEEGGANQNDDRLLKN